MTQDIVLLSGGAAHGLVAALEPAFRADTGAGISGTFGAVGAMRDLLRSGTAADLLILTGPIIADLVREGRALADSVTDIGLVRTAVAVRAGDAAPDVSGADALRAALLAADEIYFPDPALATAGIHFAGVLDRLGIAGQMADRLRIHPNGARAMAALAASGAARPIGCTQITEILITPGVRAVGSLPDPFGLATTYVAAVCAGSPRAALARGFIAAMVADTAAGQRRRSGFE
ncbi:MAG: substrate-binding domain-containing protein [Paracoccaceae bacterium]|nr:MAG: substrate-binding domain-containing protein [Paracoccaceae bacterium]